jgi:hypothetical protein
MLRSLSFFFALLITGCNHKLFPSAHVSNKTLKSHNTLYYFYDYTESDESGRLKVNNGWQYGRGLKAMTEIDSILERNIKYFGFDTMVRLEQGDRIVVDSIWNKLEHNLNDSAFQFVNKLSDKLRGNSTILKIRLNVSLFTRNTSGLGFYSNGNAYGNYLGILLQIYEGEIHNFSSLRSTPNLLTMKNTMFYPKRSRKFLDRILMNNLGG